MACYFAFCLTLVALVSISLLSTNAQDSDPDPSHRAVLAEERLYKRLMTGYNNKVRPSNGTTTVSFGVALIKILELESIDEVLKTHLWARYSWQDFRLQWNILEFDGVAELRMDVKDIWTPDLLLYNSVGEQDDSYKYDAMAVVSSDGTVLWVPPILAQSSCALDFTWFPFDDQTCIMKFGSWTYDGFQVDLRLYDDLKEVDMSDYVSHGHWKLLGTKARKNIKYYPCCDEPYPDITFSINLRRDTSYFRRLFIGPAALMAMLAPFIFMLPPGTGEKTRLGMGMLLILYLCIMMLDYYIGPSQAGNSVLGYFYYITFVLVALSTAISALISNMAVRGPRTGAPPAWMRKVFLDLIGRLVCVSYSSASYNQLNADLSSDGVTSDTANIIKDPNEGSRAVREYQLIAMVFDRLLFVTSVLIFVLTTISMVAK